MMWFVEQKVLSDDLNQGRVRSFRYLAGQLFQILHASILDLDFQQFFCVKSVLDGASGIF